MKKALFVILLALMSVSVFARERDKSDKERIYKKYSHFSLAFRGGATLLDGDVSQAYNEILPKSNLLWTLGGQVAWDLNQFWGLNFDYTYSPYGGVYVNKGQAYSFIGRCSEGILGTQINLANLFAPYRKRAIFNAYLNLGMGLSFYTVDKYKDIESDAKDLKKTTPDETVEQNRAVSFPIGLSFEFNPIKQLSIFLQADYRLHNKDNFEGDTFRGGQNDNFLAGSVGLRYKIGNYKKKDHVRNIGGLLRLDVEDENDKLLARVSSLESKMDSLSQLHDHYQVENEQRLNYYDRVFTIDEDGDGIPDVYDQSPGTPPGVLVDKYGVPIDSDHDGTPDYLDRCPDVPGVQENHGCPRRINDYHNTDEPIFARTVMRGEDSFPIGGYELEGDNPSLNNVVRVLLRNPDYKVNIVGYSDNIGEDSYNMQLSLKRAQSVEKYLLRKGSSKSQIGEVKGLGSINPVADNKTREGRALNRRVEITIIQHDGVTDTQVVK